MSYFSLRKHEPEPEPDLVEEDPDEAVDESEDEGPEEEQTGTTNPLVIGVLGPGAWIAARFGTGAAWAVHIVAVWAVSFYGGWTAAGILLAWLAAVLLFVPKEYLDRATAWIERRGSPPQDDSEEPVGPDPQDVIDLVRDVIGDDRGALLTALRQPLRAPDTKAVREVLAAAGMRVRPGVRTGAGNGPGVHREDLPPLSPADETPDGERCLPRSTANNNTNSALRVQSREGMTIINDPADRHRTHSLKKP